MSLKAIKICFVSPKSYALFYPESGGVFGGAEVDLYHIGTELAKDGAFEVSFITADYGQDAVSRSGRIRIIKSLNFAQNPLLGAYKLSGAFRSADADIYMIKTASAGVWLTGRFCRKYNRKFIYRTAHQDECDGTWYKKHPLAGRMFVGALKKADMVLAQNISDADNLKKLYSIDSVVVPNGHPIGQADNNGNRDIILWAGRSAGFKRPQIFIDLAGQMPDEKFVMICQKAAGDREYGRLKEAAAKVENLEFIESVPFAEIDSYFRRTKIFVNTSRAEGFANTFIQACRSAAAILTLNSNPDGFLDKYNCGICCNGDEKLLVEKMSEMLDPETARRMGLNGLQYVKDTHDITKIIEVYKEAFRKLVS